MDTAFLNTKGETHCFLTDLPSFTLSHVSKASAWTEVRKIWCSTSAVVRLVPSTKLHPLIDAEFKGQRVCALSPWQGSVDLHSIVYGKVTETYR